MARKKKDKVKKKKKVGRKTKDTEKKVRRKKKTRTKKTSTRKKRASKKSKKASTVDGFAPDYEGVLETVEKQHKLGRVSMDKEARRQSSCTTGLFVLDLVLGNGGVVPGGWYTFYGPEQSAKSTTAMQIVNTVASDDKIPLLPYFDSEGSSDPNYIENMYSNKLPADELFGVYDEYTGKYIVKPRVRYYGNSVIETFFNSVKSMLNKLPDKLYDEGKWWYVYENTKANRKKVGSSYDKGMFSKHNAFYVPADTPYPQALVVVDSYPALIPERMDEKEDGGGGMAEAARAFSENIKKIRGKLRSKGVVIVGVNQLRLRPAVMFGNPEYEPCGETLKFAADVRIKSTPRAIPHNYGKGMLEEEDSVLDEGVDTYRYIHLRAIKNKLSTPYLEGWARLWVKDANSIARGFDPVWDTFQYLKMTGQIKGTMKKMSISIGDKVHIKKLSWMDFKSLVLLSGKELKALCKKLGIKKNPKLRERCARQLASGIGEKLFYDCLKQSNSKKKDKDEDE